MVLEVGDGGMKVAQRLEGGTPCLGRRRWHEGLDFLDLNVLGLDLDKDDDLWGGSDSWWWC